MKCRDEDDDIRLGCVRSVTLTPPKANWKTCSQRPHIVPPFWRDI